MNAVGIISRICLERQPHWKQKCSLLRHVVSGQDRWSQVHLY